MLGLEWLHFWRRYLTFQLGATTVDRRDDQADVRVVDTRSIVPDTGLVLASRSTVEGQDTQQAPVERFSLKPPVCEDDIRYILLHEIPIGVYSRFAPNQSDSLFVHGFVERCMLWHGRVCPRCAPTVFRGWALDYLDYRVEELTHLAQNSRLWAKLCTHNRRNCVRTTRETNSPWPRCVASGEYEIIFQNAIQVWQLFRDAKCVLVTVRNVLDKKYHPVAR